MEMLYSAPRRGERLIAMGRIMLALFSVFSAIVGPFGSFGRTSAVYALITLYSIYALVLPLIERRSSPSWQFKIVTHVVDLIVFSSFVLLTTREGSPFFAFFFFSLLCATMRFGVPGTIWTGLAVVSVFSAIGFAEYRVHPAPVVFDLFILRAGQLAVVAGLLTFLASYLQRLHTELSGLASWPRTVSRNPNQLILDTLQRSAEFLNVPRVVMVWTEYDEPWLQVASYSPDGFKSVIHRPDDYEPLVAEGLEEITFFSADICVPTPMIVAMTAFGRGEVIRKSPLNTKFRDDFSICSVLSTSLVGQTGEGRICYLDRKEMGGDELRMGEILSRLIVSRMDQLTLSRQAERTAIAEERVRLARDLHDGLLQSLTATALQIEAARRMLNDQPREVDERLSHIHDDITQEHEDLRSFIRELRPTGVESEVDFRLTSRLNDLADGIGRQWGVEVSLDLNGTDRRLPNSSKKEIYRLIREAVINAAKHAAARKISVVSAVADGHVEIVVTDDGKGFPFFGSYDLQTLTRLRKGPRTLKERIASVSGDLRLISSPSGVRLEMKLPLVQHEGWTS